MSPLWNMEERRRYEREYKRRWRALQPKPVARIYCEGHRAGVHRLGDGLFCARCKRPVPWATDKIYSEGGRGLDKVPSP